MSVVECCNVSCSLKGVGRITLDFNNTVTWTEVWDGKCWTLWRNDWQKLGTFVIALMLLEILCSTLHFRCHLFWRHMVGQSIIIRGILYFVEKHFFPYCSFRDYDLFIFELLMSLILIWFSIKRVVLVIVIWKSSNCFLVLEVRTTTIYHQFLSLFSVVYLAKMWQNTRVAFAAL